MYPKVNHQSSLNNWGAEIKPDLFDIHFSDSDVSAIDLFMNKNNELNQLSIDPTGKTVIINEMIANGQLDETEGRKVLALLAQPINNAKFYNLILLGYVSSVEAYVRKLIRDLVNLDPYVRTKCELQTINLGATYYQDKVMYPEALMEHSHFIKGENIRLECNKLLDISMQFSPGSALQVAIKDYDSICQLRHCIVHRFGNIGVNNIISLGIHKEDFKHCIEKPVALNFNSIQKASKVTVNLVRELNHEIWTQIMKRLLKDPCPWTWDLRTDKKQFLLYLELFYDTSMGPLEDKYKSIYNEYRTLNEARS